MEKVIRDGKVAVILSGGWDDMTWSTWYSEGRREVLMFHPKIVAMVEEGRHNEITPTWIERELGLKKVYTGGAKGLYIKWVPVGTKFYIDEYKGYERLITFDNMTWITA